MRRTADRAEWEEIFRGYDIRGLYPREIGPTIARRLGYALGRALPGPFLVGRDTRRASKSFALGLRVGLRSAGARLDDVGIVPTPEVAFLAGRFRRYGLAVTPSHNPLGYVGLKGFAPSGRLFDREWRSVHDAYQVTTARGARGSARVSPRSTARAPGALGPWEPEYLAHLTDGLACDLTVVLDTRGGATARVAPAALRRMGARVKETTSGFSSDFFGQSPEPRADTLTSLSDRILAARADVGFAFDGDGDRCVILDSRGDRVEPEVIALLLHEAISDPGTPIVASVDASQILERRARTIRSRVGGRYVTRAMRRAGAEVALEPSGHYYVRRYGADSDGLLIACLVCDVVRRKGAPLRELSRRIGRVYRGAFAAEFRDVAEARQALQTIERGLGSRARSGLDGITVEFPDGWCLVRRSNTQPSVRFAYEATGIAALRRLDRTVRALAETGVKRGRVRGPT
ncbi:MAG: hypothetical protein WA691_06890 [Thermoplasmata archaeon]